MSVLLWQSVRKAVKVCLRPVPRNVLLSSAATPHFYQGKDIVMGHRKNLRTCVSAIFFVLVLISAQLPTFTYTIEDADSGLLETGGAQKAQDRKSTRLN